MQILGIDIGGSGIKGAPVDTDKGILLTERLRIETPQPSSPEAVAATVAQLTRHFDWHGPIGCGIPGPVRNGELLAAANIDKGWIGSNAQQLFSQATGQQVTVINDADAAGYAEIQFGAGRGRTGLIVIVTLGTGIGTALFINGRLVPNTEFGHIEINGEDAEEIATARARKAHAMSWKQWAKNVDLYLQRLHFYLWPDLIIIGGGVSKKSEKFLPLLTVDVDVVPAQLLNNAGIIGAALGRRKVINSA